MDSKIAELIALYLCDALDGEQELSLKQWIEQSEENRLFLEKMEGERKFKQHLEHERGVERAIRRFDSATNPPTRRKISYVAVAAASLLLLFVGRYLLLQNGQNGPSSAPTIAAHSEYIQVENKPAVLILGDGTRLELVTEKLTEIDIAGVNITQEELIYSTTTQQESVYNTLYIPRGGEYRVSLSDGTVVRLNSGTTLRYPVVFDNDSRRVELDGEAYFSVKASPEIPFVVEVGGIEVTAYGTEFNINSHSKQIETALVKGKVGVSVPGSGEEQQLLPSQVALFDKESHSIVVKDRDIYPYIAWTEGIFVFENERLDDIMDMLSLWYDIDVVFQQHEIKELHFTGVLRRFETIESILKAILSTVDVDFFYMENSVILESILENRLK